MRFLAKIFCDQWVAGDRRRVTRRHWLARGKFFYAQAGAVATRYKTEFGWRLSFAPDIDHDDARMAPFAVRQLFDR